MMIDIPSKTSQLENDSGFLTQHQDVSSEMAAAITAISGCGGGGSTDNEDAIISRTITSYSNSRITSLGWYAFYGCSNLTSVSLPLVATSGGNAFTACNQLADVQIPYQTK